MPFEKPGASAAVTSPAAEAGRGQAAFFPALTCARATGGYAWWYAEVHGLEALGRRYSLTLIVFVGSVFSPDYAARLRRGEPVTGFDFPAVNLAVYEHGDSGRVAQRLWIMNEHDPSVLTTEDFGLRCGRSGLRHLHDGSTVVDIDEDTTRFFGRAGPRLAARIVLSPPLLPGAPLELGHGPRGSTHYWQPLAPRATATVTLQCGELHIASSGLAYCDRNFGSGRMEDAFRRWCWAHGSTEKSGVADTSERAANDPSALILYDAERRDGRRTLLAVHCPAPDKLPEVQSDGGETEPLPPRPGGGLLWLRAPREFSAFGYRCERLVDEVLLDAPFYARFGVQLGRGNERWHGVGEYLDLDRFSTRTIQHLLRYKTRRVRT